MEFEVAVTKFFFGAVEHGADPGHLHLKHTSQFLIGESAGAQDEEMRLSRLDRCQHGANEVAFLFTKNFLKGSIGIDTAAARQSSGRFLVMPAA